MKFEILIKSTVNTQKSRVIPSRPFTYDIWVSIQRDYCNLFRWISLSFLDNQKISERWL